MLQSLINPWLLIGLAGIALPVIAHLLNRRRFDVVEWGAMQFLNPSRRTRRRLKLEELLLLLLRIALVTVIVLAVARPVIPSGFLSGFYSSGSRTVVLVIDGSNSMSRTDGMKTVYQTAVRRAIEFLRTLGPNDTVALVDARDVPRAVIESPLRDIRAVDEQLLNLPSPGGACDALAAIEKAIGILGRSSAAAREIVVFSDRQSQGWRPTNDADWARVDEMLKFPAVRPQIWVVDVGLPVDPGSRNVSVGRIEISREMSVPDFPVRLRVPIRNDSDREMQIPVRLQREGQTLPGQTQDVTVPARSEGIAEFEHSARSAGTHVLTVAAEISGDAIVADNVSHAALHISDSLSVLLVNGVPSSTTAERATFFAELAFAPPEQGVPWVRTHVVDAKDLTPEHFQKAAVVVLCNVGRIPDNSAKALAEFAAAGNGVMIACGPNTTPESFEQCFVATGLLKPLRVIGTQEISETDVPVHLAPLSIQPGWLDRFRSDPSRSFLKAGFAAWVQTKSVEPDVTAPESSTATLESDLPITLAQLSNGAPLILQARHAAGTVLLLTSTLDRTWTDLPTRSDFVPFLHEAVFHVASSRSHRNIGFAEPQVLRFMLPESNAIADNPAGSSASKKRTAAFTVTNPSRSKTTLPGASDGTAAEAVFNETFVPGVYRVDGPAGWPTPPRDAFVVNYDHAEDDLTELTEADKDRLATNDRIHFVPAFSELARRMYGEESTWELWALLMGLFLLLLVLELVLTRRSVQKGYGFVFDGVNSPSAIGSDPAKSP
ncbi:MAG: BatA domain-containing protein [Planctomycetaceae bacterium]